MNLTSFATGSGYPSTGDSMVPETLSLSGDSRAALWATFMDDQRQCGADLDAGIRVVIANIMVRTSPYGLPVIQLRGPLSAGDVRDPLYRESIEFGPRDPSAEWPVVRIRREPPWALEGNNFWQDTSTAGASVTNVLRAHVECLGPREQASQVRQQATDIASSIVPL
jgi:hypothetical protein